jgi:hypothetical protein
MADRGEAGVPQSPEVQPAPVRDQLDQTLTTHEGTERDAQSADPGSSSHLGAVDTEVTPITPPMSGPDDLVGDEDVDDDLIDPAAEITPG